MSLCRTVMAHEGEEFALPASGGMGLGKPLKLIGPVQERIPVYLGATGAHA